MAQVLRNREARCGIEVLRTESSVVMAVLDSDCTIALASHPMVWAEIGEQYRDGKHFFNFDEEWRPLFRYGPSGIEPYPVLEATRKFIRGCFSAPAGFKGGALDALVEVLPQGDIHLFVRGVGFIGRFCSLEDAQMIAAALKVDRPILFGTPEEIVTLPVADQTEVVMSLCPDYEWPSKFNRSHAEGIFEMAKKATKKKATKVAKAEAQQRRADGPVSKAREEFDRLHKANPETPSSEYIAACDKLGINRGTATTQLGRWRKEKGIAVKRGGARKKKDDAKSAAEVKKDESKPSPKAKKGKKKAAAPQSGLPKSTTKGEKRHGKKKPSSATPDKSPASAPSAAPSGSEKKDATPSSPGNSASADTQAPSGATVASTSKAADSPGAAASAASKPV